jgi:hypothetical protein
MSFVAKWFTPSKSDGGRPIAEPAPLPATPSAGDAAETARQNVLARKRKKSQTILTSPLGDTSDAEVASPTLLGMGQGKTTFG